MMWLRTNQIKSIQRESPSSIPERLRYRCVVREKAVLRK